MMQSHFLLSDGRRTLGEANRQLPILEELREEPNGSFPPNADPLPLTPAHSTSGNSVPSPVPATCAPSGTLADSPKSFPFADAGTAKRLQRLLFDGASQQK